MSGAWDASSIRSVTTGRSAGHMGDDAPTLIIGGTRGTGLLIAHLLVRSGRRVRVLARDPDRAATRLGREIEIIAGDLTRKDTLPAAISGAGHIVFTTGVRSGASRQRCADQGD
jgi:uncharacterized protein YbjT (DUF2867 family)